METDPERDGSGGDVRARIAGLVASPRARFGLLAVLLAGAAVLVLTVGGPSRAEITGAVDEAGPFASLLFVTLYAVLTVLLFPGAVLTTAAGILFGVALGTLYALIGATLGAVAAYYVARGLGREQVERIAGGRLVRVDSWLERNGFLAVLYLRLIPVFPFNALNYTVGVTGVRPRDYTLATALGIIPRDLRVRGARWLLRRSDIAGVHRCGRPDRGPGGGRAVGQPLAVRPGARRARERR